MCSKKKKLLVFLPKLCKILEGTVTAANLYLVMFHSFVIVFWSLLTIKSRKYENIT